MILPVKLQFVLLKFEEKKDRKPNGLKFKYPFLARQLGRKEYAFGE